MAANLDSIRAAVDVAANVTGTQNVAALTGEMVNLNQATADMTKKQAAMARQLQYTTDTLHKSRSEVLQYKADAIGAGTMFNPIIANLKQMGIDGEHSFKGLIQSGGVFRELLVLMHETLIMGNFSRAGGSLMVLAERTGASAALFTLFGASLVATAGGVAAFVAALIMGERESTRFANAMSATNGMAGITEGQFRAMAAAIGQDVPGGAVKGRNALLDLIAAGQFSGATLEAVGRAATELASYTGKSAADVVKDFDDMKGNAAAWAEKMNDSYHFLSEAQYEYIQRLQDQGQTEAAEQAAANDLFQSLASNGTHNLGILERAWTAVGNAVRDTFSAMEDVGRASTPDQLLAAQIAKDQRGLIGGKGGRMGGSLVNPDTDPVVIALRKQISDQQSAVAAKSQNDQIQQLGISAADSLKTLTSGLLPGPTEIANFTKNLKQQIAEVLKADPKSQYGLMLQRVEPQLIAKYTKEHTDHSGTAGAINKPDINGYVIGADDPAKLSTQLTLMKQYASATHTSESAVLALSIAQGKLNGFTKAQISELQTDAKRDDALAATKAQQTAADKAAALQQQYGNMMGGYSDKSLDLQQQIGEMNQFGEVTKNAELNALNLQIAQGKLIGFPPSELDSLRAAASGIDDLNKQMSDNARTAGAGTRAAFQEYVLQATNAGAQMKEMWTGVFSGFEDTMLTALETGKFRFRSFAQSIINDMIKMELEERILGPLIGNLGGGATGGGGLGIFSLLGNIASTFGPGGAGFGAFNGIGNSMGGGASAASLAMHQGSAFADGGIMTSRGVMPLHKYATGGVANSPQMALFGEGRGPEAYVPLPDGRSIPVSMKGGGGGDVHNHFTFNSDGSQSDGANMKNANAMQRAVVFTVQQELIRQKRDGGIFSSTGRA